MSKKRAALSKRVRFDVFKRDGFACAYCGATPPGVLLEVDHINPMSRGGQNDLTNLITACFDCNRGKAATPLSVIPQSLADQAEEVAEREAQIAGYAEVMEERRQRIERDAWRVAVILDADAQYGFPMADFKSISRFIEAIGVHETMDAAEIAVGKGKRSRRDTFKYFCGVCWSKLRAIEARIGVRAF